MNGTTCHEVVTVASQTEIDRKKAGMTLNFTHSKYIPENIQTPSEGPDEESGRLIVYIASLFNSYVSNRSQLSERR